MDPDEAWRLLLELLRALRADLDDMEARDDAVHQLEELARWLRRGGLPPKV